MQVKVSVVDDKLTIAADSKHGWGKHSEIFRLPPLAAVKSIRASCEHGVVTGALTSAFRADSTAALGPLLLSGGRRSLDWQYPLVVHPS